ncbi:hypothetical protein [Neolewinella agarilytica]|uniref:hypothetical protein n=1 Tax=Neolewinella agarilytica TaxID=478744 RepID=UPI0023538CB3|nr:hypothetical protein [Neolewinella agarilytica]
MKFFQLILIFVMVPGAVFSQDLHVHYDAYQDSLHYEFQGKVVSRPLLRKGGKIILHVTNYNDYLYELEVKTSEESYQVPSAGLGSMLLGGANSGTFDQLQGLLGTGGSVGNMFKSTSGGQGPLGMAGEDQDRAVSAQAKEQLRKFKEVMKEVAEIEEEISEVDNALQRELEEKKHYAFMQGEVFRLKTNTTLAPNMIRSLTEEYLEKLLDLKPGRELDLDDLIKQSDGQRAFGDKLDRQEINIGHLEGKMTEAEGIVLLLNTLNLPAGEQKNVNNSFEALTAKTSQLNEQLQAFRAVVPSLQDRELAALTSLRYLYEEVKAHSFSKRVTIDADADLTTLDIRLVPRDSFAGNLSAKSFAPVKVASYGGLKINASLGISFGSLFERPENYLVRDGQIFGDELDAFSPIITSFVHFYRQSKNDVSLAGTMGLGLGLGGEGGTGLQNYFFGPSLIIGKGQRVTLTSGLMGAKVDRLAQGLEVGDPYNETIVPLKSVYELGFFFGLSFNVLGN